MADPTPTPKPHVSADWFHNNDPHKAFLFVPSPAIEVDSRYKPLQLLLRNNHMPALRTPNINPGTLLTACTNGKLRFAIALPGRHNKDERPLDEYDFEMIVKNAVNELPTEIPITVFLLGCKSELTDEQYNQVLEGLETSRANITIADLEKSRR